MRRRQNRNRQLWQAAAMSLTAAAVAAVVVRARLRASGDPADTESPALPERTFGPETAFAPPSVDGRTTTTGSVAAAR